MQYRKTTCKLPTATCSGAFESKFWVYFVAWSSLILIIDQENEWFMLTVVESAIILCAEIILHLTITYIIKWILILLNVVKCEHGAHVTEHGVNYCV